MRQVNATLITIGDELLIGQVIDTNSAWMAQQLNKIGVTVRRRIAVGDGWQQIWDTLAQEGPQSDIVLITGGLGPTADDITKPLLCQYFGGRLVVNEQALQNVRDIFARLNRPLIERNIRQAEVPDVCTVLQNRRGTAPGMWFEKDGTIYVSMPGVPHEMKGMMELDVLPRLPHRFHMPTILHRTLLTAGIGESMLADHIQGWEESLPPHIKLAYLPNYGMVRLRLSATGFDAEALEREMESQTAQVKALVHDWLVTDVDEPMEATVARMLRQRGQTVATAESCTGGYIAHLLTQMEGSSEYYLGSVVSYANQVKQDLLGVLPAVLAAEGAVSEPVVVQMVRGALDALKTDYAVAVSGIMGPAGGSLAKPVGTVWVAVGNSQRVATQLLHFRFDRQRNIQLTATQALNFLRKFMLGEV